MPADTLHTATCRCGALTAQCVGDPVRVSVCHCLNCQRRSGSVFAAQARFPVDQVTLNGSARTWESVGEASTATFSFCPTCGSTVWYTISNWPEVIAVALGAFADPTFPGPTVSVFENRRHPWVAVLGDDVEHD